MKAAVLRQLKTPLSIEELRVPPLGLGQVRVRMQLAAICHSQRLEVSGGRGLDTFLPHLIGHEGVGVVEEIGPGVTKVRPGDQVVLSWIRGSGLAGGPVIYASEQGPVNAGPIATFCESPIVAEQCVTKIDPPVDPAMAVLAGCAIPTGAGAVLNAMPPVLDGSLCIFGAGGVGLAAVCGAVLAGWKQIIVADMRQPRLERALALGATQTLHIGTDDVETFAARLPGKGFDLVIECAGDAAAMEEAIWVAKPEGGRVVIVGNLESGRTIAVDPFDLIEGRVLTGSWGGGIAPDVDIPRCVRWAAEGAINYQLLMGKRFALDQVNEAMQALGGDEPGRPILECAMMADATASYAQATRSAGVS